MSRYLLFLFTCFTLLSGCGKKNIPTTPKAPAVVDGAILDQMLARTRAAKRDSLLAAKVRLVATIKRTGCRGRCPVYEARVFSNDSVSYNGILHVVRDGLYEARVDSSWSQAILGRAMALDYFALRDTYPENGILILDLPSTITSIHLNTSEKTIWNNYDAPQALIEFEQFFEAHLETLHWTPVYR